MFARSTLAALAVTLSPAAQESGPVPFDWEPDLATATAAAQRTGRPIAAYFTFDT